MLVVRGWGNSAAEGRPITSASMSLTQSEKNDVALELECLAIVFACRKFDHYIHVHVYGKKVDIRGKSTCGNIP